MSTFMFVWKISALLAALTMLKRIKFESKTDVIVAAVLSLMPGLNTIVAFWGLVYWSSAGILWFCGRRNPNQKQP